MQILSMNHVYRPILTCILLVSRGREVVPMVRLTQSTAQERSGPSGQK
jgi:hypothetical protein